MAGDAAGTGLAASPIRGLIQTAALGGGLWSLSSLGYFWLSDVLGAEIGYNDAPLVFALYYGVFCLISAIVFRTLYRDLLADEATKYLLPVLAMAALFAGYTLLVLPRLPATVWSHDTAPVEFFWATPSYFLPKSVEILFQQLLVAALVLSINRLGVSMLRLSISVALLFGGFHLTLAFSYPNPLYVLRYSVAAMAFGAMVPWLLLRVRKGLLFSYAIHWGYYALDIVAIHVAFAA